MTMRSIVLALLVAVSAVACAGPADPKSAPDVLVTQPDFRPGGTVDCLMHQTDLPNTAYEGGADARPTAQLAFLAYYTAAGREPFCDGGRATAVDQAWTALYARLTTR